MDISFEELKASACTGYTSYSGIELTSAGDGTAEGKIKIGSEHLNPSGAVHGGVSFCLGDVLGGVAFRTMGGLPVTVSSNITYFRPLINTETVYGKAEVIRFGKTTAFVEVQIFNDKMTECCRIAATYYNMKDRV
ncbi:MAG: PaaI family thioesterase [Parasporobacterium sp.]|nr:PaaI family thioesterase [Parasporobacterium sp.]